MVSIHFNPMGLSLFTIGFGGPTCRIVVGLINTGTHGVCLRVDIRISLQHAP